MNDILSMQVPVPTRTAANAQWWPVLFLKKGRKLQQITPEQCHMLMMALHGKDGAAKVPDIKLHDETGQHIGRVSYNGRVWLDDIEGEVEVPVSGRKTCVEQDAAGWAEFRAVSPAVMNGA